MLSQLRSTALPTKLDSACENSGSKIKLKQFGESIFFCTSELEYHHSSGCHGLQCFTRFSLSRRFSNSTTSSFLNMSYLSTQLSSKNCPLMYSREVERRAAVVEHKYFPSMRSLLPPHRGALSANQSVNGNTNRQRYRLKTSVLRLLGVIILHAVVLKIPPGVIVRLRLILTAKICHRQHTGQSRIISTV